MRVLLLVLVLLIGCSRYVVRDGAAMAAGVLASMEREIWLTGLLLDAAAQAREQGDFTRCRQYAEAALFSEAVARPHALRSLYLAHLPYPEADGSIPTDPQVDPGEPLESRPVEDICGEGSAVEPLPPEPAPEESP